MSEVTQATHAPAPWERDNFRSSAAFWYVVDAQRQTVAMISRRTDGMGNAQGDANARLIAAAPDLLEALKAYVANDADQFLEDDDPLYPRAVAAIAKATGATA